MDRGRLSFAFIPVLTFGAFLTLQPFAFSKEFRRETTCYSDLLHLDCGKLSFIAIHEAYFTTESHENFTCRTPLPPEDDYIEDDEHSVTEAANDSTCYEDIRISINKKCSGFKNCSYSYSELPEKNCFNPAGSFVVRFDCVREASVNKYCNSKVPAREGYIATPGYPQYYPQFKECTWTISGAEGQTILARILHLHLREASDVTPTVSDQEAIYAMGIRQEQVTRCDDDRLDLMDGIVKVVSVCGHHLDALKSVEVDAATGLEIRFRSVDFQPASGFLLYFKVQGCPTMVAGDGSRLSERNGSAAVYACDNNRVFNDTLEKKRSLYCVRDHHWSETLPPCISLEDTIITTSSTQNASLELHPEIGNNSAIFYNASASLQDTPALIEDIIVPCLLIGILVLGNIVIVVVIFILRKKHRAALEVEKAEFEATLETEAPTEQTRPPNQPPLAPTEDV